MYAAESGHASICSDLLKRNKDIVNLKNKLEDTALLLGVRNGHTDVCKVLVNAGADVNEPDKLGKVVLMIAAEKGLAKLVDILLSGDADVNQKDRYCLSLIIVLIHSSPIMKVYYDSFLNQNQTRSIVDRHVID